MLFKEYLETLSFPWFLFSSAGQLLAEGEGALFALPATAKEPECLEHYRICPIGWSTCPRGFAVYCQELSPRDDTRLILPALKVTGISTVAGRSDGLSIRTESREIESYVANMIIAYDRVSERFASIMRGNIHEIRRINTDMYHASLQAEQEIRQNFNMVTLQRLVKNVSALSQILKCRTDFIDFLSNPSIDKLRKHSVHVYRKFDKVIRGLRPTAERRHIHIFMNGTSHGTIHGIPLFDVAPYIILDNAVKYSPNDHDVTVTFKETTELINVEVTSLGPKVEDDEIMRIFSPNFRGRNAAKTGKTGSGIGLSSLDTIVSKIHGGKLDFAQDKSRIVISNVPYCDTHFKLRLTRNDVSDAI